MSIDSAVSDEPDRFMRLALAAAAQAEAAGDLPIGAVAVRDGEVIATAHNRRSIDRDPTAHAEILVLREAASVVGEWRLNDVTVVVTLEPCPMCAGALWAARVGRLVFGAADPKAGAAGSLYNFATDPRLNHETEVVPGIRAEECGELLARFFRSRRSS
jgi:tRNA(adenine34) deaminase